MKIKFAFFIILGLVSQHITAQTSVNTSSADILSQMQKLNTLGSVLYIAAHPDDENTRLLAYMANERHLRTGYLSLTRGDGGQNLIGKEQGEALGIIRTQELLAARRTDGAEQFFTRANDFGFSKNPEETFTFWNRDSILADVVWAIRNFKPDVIICRFPTTGEGGHGHHTASAMLAEEAFVKAADPNFCPLQLKYTQVWKAKRIFWNTFNFGGTNTTNDSPLKMDVGMYNVLLGKSYGEIAADSRSNHKSQGFGSSRQRGSNIEYFKLLKGDTASKDVMQNISTNWGKYKETIEIEKTIQACIDHYSPVQPSQSVPELIKIYTAIKNIRTDNTTLQYWQKLKLKETENLLLACSGIWLEAQSMDYIASTGSNVNLTCQAINRSNIPVKLQSVVLQGFSATPFDTAINKTLNSNELFTYKHKEALLNTASTNPYWLNETHTNSTYTIKDQKLVGKPQNEAVCQAIFTISIYDLVLNISREVVYKSTDPVKGEVYRNLEILPKASINISDKTLIFNGKTERKAVLTIKANDDNVKGKIIVNKENGWDIKISNPNFEIKNKGEEVTVALTITANGNVKEGTLKAGVWIYGSNKTDSVYCAKSIKRIEYDHIPYQFFLYPAETKLVNLDLKKAQTTIAYIPGAGDDVPNCLTQIGYSVTTLTDDMLATEDLSKYSSIVTGVRAYNTNKRLQIYYDKLMSYVENGGNLVVQYNTNNRIGPVQAKIGPYPFTIANERVTDEKAEVRVIKKDNTFLNYPNKITEHDFDNWIQERGIYFAKDYDSKYTTLLAMNDPNEKSNEGSIITCQYGKGRFTYTGLAFFRELPAGVPGAYRLFVNLLSNEK